MCSATWTWDGWVWTDTEQTGPAGRFLHSLDAYDNGSAASLVLVGGATPPDAETVFADAWVFGSEWVSAPGLSVSRFGHGAAVIPAKKAGDPSDALVIYGGGDDTGNLPSATSVYGFSHGGFFLRSEAADPLSPGRAGVAMAWDDKSSIILYGG